MTALPTPSPVRLVPPPAAASLDDELLTAADVSARTTIPTGTLKAWRHYGGGPRSFKLGRRVLYRRADVDAWLAEQYAATGRSGQPSP